MSDEDSMSDHDWELSHHEDQILDNIEEFGCHITVVSPPDNDGMGNDGEEDEDDIDEGERFAYSVGFPASVHQPEVIVFGFSAELSAAVINGVLDLCREGLVLEDWMEIEGILKGHRCVLREVEAECLMPYYFNSAMWFAETELETEFTRAMQIVWPGVDDGLFPWDKGCSDEVRDLQTPLYRTSLNS
ncbi:MULTISPECIES: DUF4262 domain-containing protein [unclassified Novosphingobium]|uniref:DUF4262 domain-containing protein n=1 Tax=unclassified Novosphingobium TaxID=2644732 RepID=UPI001F49155D|nr:MULTISPECIES: DUF4262 domain-containing protein [unclassified Novosphingobium]